MSTRDDKAVLVGFVWHEDNRRTGEGQSVSFLFRRTPVQGALGRMFGGSPTHERTSGRVQLHHHRRHLATEGGQRGAPSRRRQGPWLPVNGRARRASDCPHPLGGMAPSSTPTADGAGQGVFVTPWPSDKKKFPNKPPSAHRGAPHAATEQRHAPSTPVPLSRSADDGGKKSRARKALPTLLRYLRYLQNTFGEFEKTRKGSFLALTEAEQVRLD